jgi:hypothetical protein
VSLGFSGVIQSRLVVLLGAELLVIATLLGVVLDQYAHRRTQSLAGVNSWGYRGPVMPEHAPDEIRIAVVGGDAAFGWGVAPGETSAAYLRLWVATSLPAGFSRTVTAVNLGALGLPARDHADRIRQFRYLAPDVICLYFDPIDRLAAATLPPAHSAVTALTGYVPMLPLILQEKGDREIARGRWMVGRMLSVSGRSLGAADRALARLWLGAPFPLDADRGAALAEALDAALASAAAVIIVLPMPFTSEEAAGHAAARQLFERRAAAEPRMRVVDLAEQPRLADPELRLDATNYGAGGHSLVAQAIAPAVSEFVSRARAIQ